MVKKSLMLFFVAILVFISVAWATENKLDISKITISQIEFDNEYNNKNSIISNKLRNIRPEMNWKLLFDTNRYLEAKVVGKKDSDISGTYSISTLVLVNNKKSITIEENCYGFGRIAWNTKGTQFIYMKITSPPADYSMGDVYLVTIENGTVKNKKLIIKNISSSDFRWAEKNNCVVFSDFETIYLLNTLNCKVQTLTGCWANDVKKYEKGTGYPRMCGAFVWSNNDRDLFFTYYEDLNFKEGKKIYKIHFK